MEDLNTQNARNRQKIEKYLVSQKAGATINQIAGNTGLSWLTIQRHLDYLDTIGRVDKTQAGKFEIYFLNGHNKWQKDFQLNSRHKLYIDTFMTSFGKPFIRIKETKKKDANAEKWETFGEIMITEEKLEEVINFLQTIKKGIGKYKG